MDLGEFYEITHIISINLIYSYATDYLRLYPFKNEYKVLVDHLFTQHFVYLIMLKLPSRYESGFFYLKVSFSDYINKSGKKMRLPGNIIKGDLIKYSHMDTKKGYQKIGIVVGNDFNVYFVPTLSLIVLE